MTKLIPVLALTALTAFAPTQKAEAHWGCFHGGCGWHGWWFPAAVGAAVVTAPLWAPRPYPYYYGRPYPYAYRGYYGSGYSSSASVQAALAHKGFYHGAIDGVIGPQSRGAIRSYQASHGLPVTGNIDRPLLRSLRLG